ncbi:MAG TPA: TonB-dependent receptor [Allosphingosinicella sp.]
MVHSLKSMLVSGTALMALGCLVPASASAQTLPPTVPAQGDEDEQPTQPASTPTGAETPDEGAELGSGQPEPAEIVVTGSRIKQDPNNSALPLQIITNQEIQRNGISSPEQLIMYLPTNGTGADNLASNADVVAGQQRGNNGLSSANLRSQGNAATLVLLNGRRVAAHGLQGSAVDVNQIPFAAIDRIEVLKDGASAIYGTDAVGGVINFITRKDYQGFGVQGFTDITERGDSSIYRVSGIAGFGDLATQGFNFMAAVSHSWNAILRGSDRSFVNGNQPDRGLSIDTRGTPIATAFNIGANAFQAPGGTLLTGLTLTAPNGSNAAGGGINILDLPGGAGCETMDGGMAYDEQLWNTPSAFYACAWDTGRAAVIQQPIQTLTYYGRGVANLGDHQIFAEITGSDASSAKSFSNAQLSANTTNLPISYPLNAATAPTYNEVFNAIRGAFTNPAQRAALDARYGRPISYRWRCVPCGPREYETDTKTLRGSLGIEGPMWADWDYRAGASYARSESHSVLGSGYYYRGTLANGSYDPAAPAAAGTTGRGLVGVLNSGLINPFSLSQTPAGLAALQSVSAEGTTLYGGRYAVKQFDASVSGSLFPIWGGDVQVALGADYRQETYEFNGSDAADATDPVIFLAAFDNINALTPRKRNVKAAYAEVLVPLFRDFDITGAIRVDNYTGFGTTTNPKVAFKFRPIQQVLLRGSYNTSFRVPSFNQIFNGTTESPYAGSDIADPVACPGGVPTSAFGSGQACAQIRPIILTGGNLDLRPETAKQFNVGIVIQPTRNLSFSADLWHIASEDTIYPISVRDLVDNAAFFPDRFTRENGTVTFIDQRWINAGSRRTRGLELAARGSFEVGPGSLGLGMDGTYLLKKKEKLLPSLPYADSLGKFTFSGDLGLKWKHNAFVSYTTDDLAFSLTQIFRNGYRNFALPGIANGTITRPDYNEQVDDYIVYNLSASYVGAAPGLRLTAGIKNLFDTDPPFAITYDGNTGSGSSWEPRVADPRGRSFTMAAEFKF